MPPDAAQVARQPPVQLPALTTLRFVAAAAVLLAHCQPVFGLKVWNVAAAGAHGVAYFFVLSGFILRHAYGDINTLARCRRFLAGRLVRIYPVYLASLALLLILIPQERVDNLARPRALAANVALLQSWVPSPDYYYSGVCVSWSVSVEMFFYVCFPLLLLGWRRTWRLKLALAFAAALGCALAAAPVAAHFPADRRAGVLAGLTKCFPLTRLFEFTFGMALYSLWRRLEARRWSGRRLPWTGVELLAVAAVLASVGAVDRLANYAVKHVGLPTGVGFWVWQSGLGLPGIGLAVVVLALRRGRLSRLLSLRAGVFLGEMT